MTNNRVLLFIRKCSPVFNLALGIGLWALIKFAFSQIFSADAVKQAILLISLYVVFAVAYIFAIKKIGTLQITGLSNKNLLKSTIFMMPTVALGIVLSVFTIQAIKRLGIEYSSSAFVGDLPSILCGFAETIFIQEVIIVGFLSAFHHRCSKTQWNTVLISVVGGLALGVFLMFSSNLTDYKQILFQIFASIVLALVWFKYRNQIIFPIQFLGLNSYMLIIFAITNASKTILFVDEKYASQINWCLIIGMIANALTALFMILTLKYPIPKKKILYSKKTIDSEGNETVETETFIVKK